MGTVIIKIKIMPESAETNLSQIEAGLKKILKENNVENSKFEIQPIAFGLNALIFNFGWPEEKELDSIQEDLKNVEGVSSMEVIDMRRAIG